MKLDGTLTCSLNLVYGMRNVLVADVRFVGSIVEDDGVVVKRIAHPLLQFLLREHCSRGVIGIAEIYHVNTLTWLPRPCSSTPARPHITLESIYTG